MATTPVLIEGFESLSTASTSPVRPNSGARSWRSNPVTTGTASRNIQGPGANGLAAGSGLSVAVSFTRFYMYIATLPSAEEIIFRVLDSTGTRKVSLTINAAGNLTLRNASNASLGTGSTVLSTGAWYRLDVKCATGGTGAYEVKINGVSELSGTGSIGANNTGYVQVGKAADTNGSGYDIFYDDIRMDSDDYPTEGYIKAMLVDSLGADTDFLSSSGGSSTVADVSGVPFVDDGQYAKDLTSGHAQTYGLQSASAAGISGTINAVLAMLFTRDAGGTTSSAVRIRSGSNVLDGTGADLGGYAVQSMFAATEVVSGSAWTTTLLNSVEIGLLNGADVEIRCQGACLQVDYTPLAGNVPADPDGLSVESTTGTTADLTWNDNSGASDDDEDSFEVEYDTSPNFTNATDVTGIAADAESTTITGLEPFTVYYFRIRAVNGVGNSNWSAAASGTTTTNSQSSLTQDEITLTFDTSYAVGRYDCGGGYFVVADGGGEFTLNSVAASSPGVASTIGAVMVDPGTTDLKQGFDSRAGNYDAARAETLPLTVDVSGGVPKTVWVALTLDTPESGGGNSTIRSIVQLTVVPSAPAGPAIKPTGMYVSGGKRQVLTSEIDFDAMTPVAVPVGAEAPQFATNLKYHQRGLVRFGGTATSAQICPTLYQDSYPGSQALFTHDLLLGAISDSSDRNVYIKRIVRCYLDIQAIADLGDTAFITLGGFGCGGKGLWFLGGVFLGDTLTLPSQVTYAGKSVNFFHEDGGFFLGEADGSYPLGKPLYGRDHTVGEPQYHNHDMRDLDGVREPYWLVTTSGTAQSTSANTIQLAAGTTDAVGSILNKVYAEDNAETKGIDSWADGTKTLTLDENWTSTPAGTTTYEGYAGSYGYQITGSQGAVGCAFAVVCAGLTDEYLALGGEGDAFFAYVARWIEDIAGVPPEHNSATSTGGDESLALYGDADGTWAQLFYESIADWPETSLATVTTNAAADVGTTSATLGGEVASDGGAAVTERGVVLNTTGTPTTSDTKDANGTGIGTFSKTVSGLVAGTGYYVRAYAINSVGTAYGSQQTFTTDEEDVVIGGGVSVVPSTAIGRLGIGL